jgi:small multidrug resistance pump
MPSGRQFGRPPAGPSEECRVTLNWLALALAIGTSMIGQTLLKAGAGAATFLAQLLDIRTVCGLGLYGASALLYIIGLRRIPMSVALPCTAISYVVAALIGHYAFDESISIVKLGGLAMICLGVVMLTAG